MILNRSVAMEVFLHCILIFSVMAFACTEPWSVALLQILVALHFMLTAWTDGVHFRSLTQDWMVPATLGIAVIGLIQLTNVHPTTWPNTSLFFSCSADGTKKGTLLWMSYSFLLLTIRPVLDKAGAVKRLCWTIFGLGVLVGIAGLGIRSENSHLLLGFRKIPHAFVMPFGPFVNRDHAASFLAMCGLVGWGICFTRIPGLLGARFGNRFIDSVAQTITMLVLLAVIAFCIIKTGSRGGTHAFFLASFATGLLAALKILKGNSRKVFGAILGLTCVAYAVVISQFPFWRGYANGVLESSLQSRISMYRGGWTLFGDYTATGIGLGSLAHAFPAYQEPFVQGLVEHIHSDWLELCLQVGLIGCGIWVAILALTVVSGLCRWISHPRSEMRALLGGALGAVAAMAIHMIMDFPFQIPANAITFLSLIAIIGARPQHKQTLTSPHTSRMTHYWSRIIATCAATGVILLSIPPIVADAYYFRAMRYPHPARIYFLNAAVQWDDNPKYTLRMAQTYSDLALGFPLARRSLYRSALSTLAPIANRYPLDENSNRLHAFLTYSLAPDQDTQSRPRVAERPAGSAL